MHAPKSIAMLGLLGITTAGAIGSTLAQESEVSRAQVRAELLEAQRLGLTNCGDGDCLATPEQSQMIQNAGRSAVGLPKVPVYSPAPLSRAQVRAEARAAAALGLVPQGDGNMPIGTPEQERQIADAGRRAAEATGLASR